MQSTLRDLDLFSLMVFKSIYETQHANVTAKTLGVSAPKISRCLNSLRGLFDDELFYRRQSGLLPTPLAEGLYGKVAHLVDHFDELSSESIERRGNASKVRLAIMPSFLPALAKLLVQKQNKSLLDRLELVPWGEGSIEALHRGELDMGFCLEKPGFDDLEETCIGRCMDLFLVGSEHHPIWQQIDTFDLDDLFNYPFIYQVLVGFNDRIDPMELLCTRQGQAHRGFEAMVDEAHWYARLLCSEALSFSGPGSVTDHQRSLPGLRFWPIPVTLFDEAHKELGPPCYRLLERRDRYRRYDSTTKAQVQELLSQLF